MVAKPAHVLAGVAVVVRVASVRRVQAELPAVVQRADVLVHGVDGLQYAPRELLELAQLDRLVHAVVLQVVRAGGRLERPLARHRQPVHVRHLALGRPVVVVGRPVSESEHTRKSIHRVGPECLAFCLFLVSREKRFRTDNSFGLPGKNPRHFPPDKSNLSATLGRSTDIALVPCAKRFSDRFKNRGRR